MRGGGGRWASTRTGAGAPSKLKELRRLQEKGDEIAIHAVHPSVPHHSWFPTSVGRRDDGSYNAPQAYFDTEPDSAMDVLGKDLAQFLGALTDAGIRAQFARLPGGELSEVAAYLRAQGVAGDIKSLESKARTLIAGQGLGDPMAEKVEADFAKLGRLLEAEGLKLWGGSSAGPLHRANSWEAESSPTPSLTNDVIQRFRGLIEQDAGRPRSLIILAHDTSKASADLVARQIGEMEALAAAEGFRIEYYTMSGLYSTLRARP